MQKVIISPPLVSVVIPVFNGALYLRKAVESVQKSTFKNFEILLIDDGSTDASHALCRELEKEYSENVRYYIFSENQGLGRVLNFALKEAHGEYICRLNQDDIMLPHRIQTQVDYLTQHPDVVALGSSIHLFDENHDSQLVHFASTDEDIKRYWHIVSPFADPSVMYRRDVALKAGGYKQEFWPADDTHLWYRMGQIGKLANLQEPVVHVRWHTQAASVKHFRSLNWSTYRMHRWAHSHVARASIFVQLFWVLQVVCGVIFSAQFNWAAYRIMKKIMYQMRLFNARVLRATTSRIAVMSVMNQPNKLNTSGQ